MRIDALYPYIVPLTFLAIWALTSLFNRDTQPLPPRTGRPLPPPGPLPPGQATVRTGEPRPGLTARPANGAGLRPVPSQVPRPLSRRDGEILIIESEPRRPSNVEPARQGPASARRGAKGRPSPAAAPRPEEPPRRTLGTPLDRPVNLPLDQPPALTRLTLPASPLTGPSVLTAKPEGAGARASERQANAARDLRALLTSPERVRESILVNELLSPPVALRRRPRP